MEVEVGLAFIGSWPGAKVTPANLAQADTPSASVPQLQARLGKVANSLPDMATHPKLLRGFDTAPISP